MLRVDNISKTFNPGTVNEKTALDRLSLHLAPGDFAAVIGSNGAGKSTLLNAVAGSFTVDSGSITLGGRDVTFVPNHRRSRVIGRLFQDPLRGTAPSLTIEENLALAYLRSSEGTAPLSRIRRKDKEFFAQRLLLDEHTAALDPATAEKVLELTRSMVAEHQITCLMVTHNMRQALELGSRTLMMSGGRIVLDVSGEERAGMTVEDLLARFKAGTGTDLDNDRMLLSD